MKRLFAGMMLLVLAGGGCSMPSRSLDNGAAALVAPVEAEWIRNGQPMEFDDLTWYPTDDVERLLDNEMYKIGQYKDVPVFIERIEVKPYARVYTRFEKGRYRAFEPRD
ncbi:MAG: hypothetical protein WCO69_01780 [Candidatus Omnitrophota bacterium]